jgi:hypothetical protein
MTTELESRLVALGRGLDWPAAPSLGPAVRGRVENEPRAPRRRAWRSPRRVLVPALLLVALCAGTTMAAVPDVRDSVLRLLHLKGADVVRVPRLPPIPPRGNSAGLGPQVTLAEARARAGFAPLLPDSSGWTAHLRDGALSFTRGRLLVGEFRGVTRRTYVIKEIGPGTTVRRVTVRGARAWWIAGNPHGFAYEAPDGTVNLETLRLAGNTLLWNEDGLLVRIEGARSLGQALGIARALHR